MENLIPLSAAAARLSVTVRTIYNLAKADPKFPQLLKVGSATRIRERELIIYVESLGAIPIAKA